MLDMRWKHRNCTILKGRRWKHWIVTLWYRGLSYKPVEKTRGSRGVVGADEVPVATGTVDGIGAFCPDDGIADILLPGNDTTEGVKNILFTLSEGSISLKSRICLYLGTSSCSESFWVSGLRSAQSGALLDL
ncbi:hypothetical protein P9112_002964 [Eukaryota sp. TZLM1-RC]